MSDILPAAAFDYTALDAETRIVVQQRTGEIRTIAHRTATDIVEIGAKLIEVKAKLGHGKFGQWLVAEFAWEERTALRFMQVAERFQNRQIVGFAPSALYLLASPSAPDEARNEALQRAATGERIGVPQAKAIVDAHKPPAAQPQFATAEQLTPTVRSWLASFVNGSRAASINILRQITLQNPVGIEHINRLAEYARKAGQRGLYGDLRKACGIIYNELINTPAEPGRVVVTGQPAPAPASAPAAAPVLTQPEPEPEPQPEPARPPSLNEIYQWLNLAPENNLSHAALDHAINTLAGALDHEGFAARRGRNFQWESLIGHIGADVDHDALRAVVRECWQQLVNRRAASANEEPVAPPADDAPTGDSPAQTVQTWLTNLVENNQLADDEDGKRLALNALLHGRNNGGAQLWRALRTYNRGRWLAADLVAGIRQLLGLDPDPVVSIPAAALPSPQRLSPPPANPAPAGNGAADKIAQAVQQLAGVRDDLIEYAGGLENGDARLAGIIEQVANILDLLTTETPRQEETTVAE